MLTRRPAFLGAFTPGLAILAKASSPGFAILAKASSPGFAILPKASSPGFAILPKASSPGFAILAKAFTALLLLLSFTAPSLAAAPTPTKAPVAAKNVNTANAEELMTVKGVGEKTAAKIIAEREKGPFKTIEELGDRVKGVGDKTVQRFKDGGWNVGTVVPVVTPDKLAPVKPLTPAPGQ